MALAGREHSGTANRSQLPLSPDGREELSELTVCALQYGPLPPSPHYFLWRQLTSCAAQGSVLITQHPVSACFIVYTPEASTKTYLPGTSLWLLAWPNH